MEATDEEQQLIEIARICEKYHALPSEVLAQPANLLYGVLMVAAIDAETEQDRRKIDQARREREKRFKEGRTTGPGRSISLE